MGILEVTLTTQALLTVVMRLGLQGSISRFYFDCKGQTDVRNLVTTTVVAVIVFSALFTALGFVFGPFLFHQLFAQIPFHPYMDLALITAFFMGPSDFQRRLLQVREQSAYAAKLAIAFGLLDTALDLLLVIKFRMGVMGVMWSNLICAVLFAFVAWYNHRSDLRGRFDFASIRASLKYGLPLVPHHGAAWAQQSVGRWVLGSLATAAMVGELGLASKIASPLIIMTGAFASAYTPVYFSWRSQLSTEEALSESRRIGRAVLVCGCIAVIGAATFGSFVVRHVTHRSYVGAGPLVGVIAASLFAQLIYTLIAVEIFYAKQSVKWISIVFVTSALVNFGMAAMLAGRFGAMAAALAQLVGGLVSIFMVSRLSLRTFSLPLGFRESVAAFVIAGVSCFVPLYVTSNSALRDLMQNFAVFAVLGGAILLLSGVHRQVGLDLLSLRTRVLERHRRMVST